ncbi:unnamed protein product [Urochloa humidicola]
MEQRAAAASGGGEWWRGAVGACTEGLGSETGDTVGYVTDADIIDWLRPPSADAEEEATVEEPHLLAALPSPEEEEEKERQGRRPRRGYCLPPVMPRAAEALVMRAERSGGRLILTEVPGDELSQRRVVFRASRDGGRLQLCFAAAGGRAGKVGAAAAAAAAAGAVPDDGAAGKPEEAREQAGSGEFCQVAAAAGRGRLEVGAVVGI